MLLVERGLQILLSGLSIGCVYAVAGLALVLVFKSTRMVDFSQGTWVVLGGIIAAFLYKNHLPLVLCIPLAVVGALVIGVACWRLFLYNPWTRGSSGLNLIMLSVGVAMAVSSIMQITFGSHALGLPTFARTKPIHIGSATMSAQAPWLWGVTLLLMIGLTLLFNRTYLGKQLRATHQRHLGARLVGLNPPRLATIVYALAVALAAICGVVMTPMRTVVYDGGTFLVVMAMVVYLVGGATSLVGAVIAGLAIGLLEAVGGAVVSTRFMDIIPLAVAFMFLLYRPTGLFGEREPGE